MFMFVTVDSDPFHACLFWINENKAKLTKSVHPHAIALG